MTGVSIVLPPTFLPFFFCCLTAFFLPCLIFPYVPLVFGDDQYSVLWYNQVLLWFLVLIPGTAYYIVMSVLGQYARYCLCTWYLMMSDYAVCGLYIYICLQWFASAFCFSRSSFFFCMHCHPRLLVAVRTALRSQCNLHHANAYLYTGIIIQHAFIQNIMLHS